MATGGTPRGPYRDPCDPPGHASLDRSEPEAELLLPFALVLVSSMARVVAALVRAEAFAAEPTVALFLAAGSGAWIGGRALRWLRR